MRWLGVSSLLVLSGLGADAYSQQAVAPAARPALVARMEIAPTLITRVVRGPDASGKYKLREGMDLVLAFSRDVSSKTAVEGDPVRFTLVDDLRVNGVVVAKAGCKAVGEVARAERPRMMGKAGELDISLDYLKVGDEKVALRGTKDKKGESGTRAAMVLTVLFGPIGLIKHGKNVDIKQGQSLHAFVADDISLPPIS